MAISFTRPDPSAPSSVASASFTTARKGFETNEVREFLRMVAAEMARLQERERFLERELRTAQRSTSPTSVALDEELVTKMLGEEAARILHTARDGASQIKVRSEENAARLLREAADEAQRVREAAEIEAARRRTDATADAESELEMAKQQGREMVNEARAYRERVLNELARRREIARQQIEQLIHGRDRLLQSFERSRLVAVDVMAELTPLGEPSEYVNLSPTTGPVPLMLPNTPRPPERQAAPVDPFEAEADPDATVALAVTQEHADRASVEHGDPSVTIYEDADFEADFEAELGAELEAELEAEQGAESDAGSLAIDDEMEDGIVVVVDDAVVDDAVVDDAVVDDAAADDAGADDGDDNGERVVMLDISPHDPATTDDGDDREPAPVVSLFATEGERRGTADHDEVVEVIDFGAHRHADGGVGTESDSNHDLVEPDDAGSGDPAAPHALARTSADDLFARLRAARADSVAQRAMAGAEAPPHAAPPAAGIGETGVRVSTRKGRKSTATTSSHGESDDLPVALVDHELAIGDVSVFASTPDAPRPVVDVVDSPFARRDEALTPLILASARKLKRVLADEQNEVLHALRRKEPVRELDSMLATEREQSERYGSSIAAELTAAATAGAVSVGLDVSAAQRTAKKASVIAPAVDTLVTEVVAPLRERLARCVSDADGDNIELASLVRLAYREWKNQRIDEHLDDVARMAFGRGAFVGVAPGSRICWLVDPSGPACADAEDNALGGVIRAGEAFPTDHLCAPAHSGCRCMIAPAD